jgi:hypothetical protein
MGHRHEIIYSNLTCHCEQNAVDQSNPSRSALTLPLGNDSITLFCTITSYLFLLPTSYFLLPTSYFLLPTSDRHRTDIRYIRYIRYTIRCRTSFFLIPDIRYIRYIRYTIRCRTSFFLRN